MPNELRILVADAADLHTYYMRSLARMGHRLVAAVETGEQLVRHFRCNECDLVISDCELPDMLGIEAAKLIYSTRCVPIIHVCRFDHEEVEWQTDHYILLHLVKPIGRSKLSEGIADAMQQFRQFEILRKEAEDSQLALKQRQTVIRAMNVMSRHDGTKKEDAFKKLQQLADERAMSISGVAESILTRH